MSLSLHSAIVRLLVAIIVFAGFTSVYSQDLPPSNAVSTPIQSESIIIPMNEALQSKFQEQEVLNFDFTGFNVSSYGLVYALLEFGVPVQWVIRAGKGKDEVDFNADAQIIYPTVQPVDNYDFITSAFIVKLEDMESFDNCLGETTVSPVLDIIEDFGNEVTVMRLKEDIVVDVMYVLRNPPSIAVIDDGDDTYVHRDVLLQAGIPFAQLSSNQFFTGNICFSFISQPHLEFSTNQYVQTVDEFVNNGGNFFAQCVAVETFEVPGLFQTTSGVIGVFSGYGSSNSLTYEYFENDQAVMQFEGELPDGIHGSAGHYFLSPGSSFNPSSYLGIVNQIGDLIYSSADLNGGTPGGNVFYLAGHEFEGIDIPNWFGPVSPDLAAQLPLNQEYKRIYLNAAFVPSFVNYACAGQDACVCPGEPVVLGCPELDQDGSYQWSPSTGLSCDDCPFPVATPNQTTTYTMTDVEGCTASEVTVYLDDTNAAVAEISGSGSTSGCVDDGTAIELNISLSESGDWTFSVLRNGVELDTYEVTGDEYTIEVDSPGTYTIGTASLAGSPCPNAISMGEAVIAAEGEDFNFPLGSNKTICEGVPYIIGAPNLSNPNYTFLWHDGSTESFYEITTAGTYSVEVNYGDCFDDGSVTIEVFPDLIPPDIPSEVIECGEVDFLADAYVEQAKSYLWSTGETTSSIQIDSVGIYSVEISDTCSVVDVEFEVILDDIEEIQPFFVPTAFSPNGDGINDVFRPIVWEGPQASSMEFYVYNRWGELVFESTSLEIGWSGKFAGAVSEMGVYAWLYKLRGPSCEGEIEIVNQGNVTLIY